MGRFTQAQLDTPHRNHMRTAQLSLLPLSPTKVRPFPSPLTSVRFTQLVPSGQPFLRVFLIDPLVYEPASYSQDPAWVGAPP